MLCFQSDTMSMFKKFQEVSSGYLPKVLGTLWVSFHLTANIWTFFNAKTNTREEFNDGYLDFNNTSYQLNTGMAKIILLWNAYDF